ncbi:MAG: polyisoprenoid-binding protein [Bacteroidetes bacterium]|nr:polyisoprenoid-binding protein [Bacteroidota bacterium]
MSNTAIQSKWSIDPVHSEIGFRVRHMVVSNVKGKFQNFKVDVITQGNDFSTAQVKVDIEANSVFTDNEQRDNHLRSADFFDAANHTHLHFESTQINKISEENYKIIGNLTIRGIQKEVILDAEFGGIVNDPYGKERAGFTLSGKINRKDFGLNWSAALEAGGMVVSDEVKLNIDAEIVKA